MNNFLVRSLFCLVVFVSQVIAEDSTTSLPMPAIYCVGENALIEVIDPSASIPAVVKTLTLNDNEATAITSTPAAPFQSGNATVYVYCASFSRPNQYISIIKAASGSLLENKIQIPGTLKISETLGLTAVIAGGTPYVYCTNQKDNTVEVINANKIGTAPTNPQNALVSSIKVGRGPARLTTVNVKGIPYVCCSSFFANKVSVINAAVVDDSPIEAQKALYAEVVTGTAPFGLTSVTANNKPYVYCANNGGDTVAVIDMNALVADPNRPNKAVTKITVGDFPLDVTSVTVNGKAYVYCALPVSNKVVVIDAISKDVVSTISVGKQPYRVISVVANNKPYVYCSNYGDKTISVIDPGEEGSDPKISTTIQMTQAVVDLTTVMPTSASSVNNNFNNALKYSGSTGEA